MYRAAFVKSESKKRELQEENEALRRMLKEQEEQKAADEEQQRVAFEGRRRPQMADFSEDEISEAIKEAKILDVAENNRINRKIREEKRKEEVSVRMPAPIQDAEKDVRNLKIVEDACKNEEREIWLKECKSIDAKIGHNNVIREMKIAELKQLDKRNADLKNEKRKFEALIEEKFPTMTNKKRRIEPLSPLLPNPRETRGEETREIRSGGRESGIESAYDETRRRGTLLSSKNPVPGDTTKGVPGAVDRPPLGGDQSKPGRTKMDRAKKEGTQKEEKDEFEIAKLRGYKGRREDFIPGFNRMNEKEREEAKKERDAKRGIFSKGPTLKNNADGKGKESGKLVTSTKSIPPDSENASARAAKSGQEEGLTDGSGNRPSQSKKPDDENKKDLRKVIQKKEIEKKGKKPERKKFVKEKIYSSSSSESISSSSLSSSTSSSESEIEEDKKAKKRKLKLKEELKEALERKSKSQKTASNPQDEQRLAREEQERLHPEEFNGSAQRLKKKGNELRKRLQFNALVEEDEEEELGAAGGQ